MSSEPSPPPALSVRTYVEDGATILAILLVWGIIAAAATLLIGNVGARGSPFQTIGPWLGSIIGLAGVLNAILFVLYRAIDYWRV